MGKSTNIHKKWIENFNRCPLVDRRLKSFRPTIARQLFYGKQDEGYPAEYPCGFQKFYNSHYELERSSAIETVLRYLHFIGIRLHEEAVASHLRIAPQDFHQILKKSYYLLRTLAHHRENLNLSNPFSENSGDIYFFIRIETGQGQLALFDMDLRKVGLSYGRQWWHLRILPEP